MNTHGELIQNICGGCMEQVVEHLCHFMCTLCAFEHPHFERFPNRDGMFFL